MIQNQEQLEGTRAAIANLERALECLKRDILPKNPRRFALMAEATVADIIKLRSEVDEYIGLNAAISQEAEIWMALKGREMEFDDAPASIVGTMLRILRSGIVAIAQFSNRRSPGTLAASVIREACDPRIVAWAPGSIRIGLRLPDVAEQQARDEAREALHLYLRAAEWVGSDAGPERFEEEVRDGEFRRLLLNQVSQLIPRPQGGLELVELTNARMGGTAISLRREGRARVRLGIERSAQTDLAEAEKLITVEGVLREIDLDERTFIVRDLAAGVETRCGVPEEQDDLLAIAKQALDHRVTVIGKRGPEPYARRLRPLRVVEIEELDTAPDEIGD
jgi:hypothetical protein